MKKTYLIAPITIAAAVLAGVYISDTYDARALDPYEEIANSWYQQLVVEGKSEAVAYSNQKGLNRKAIYSKLIEIDDPQNPYDSIALSNRGLLILRSKGNKYEISIANAYSIPDVDQLTNLFRDQIEEKVGPNATEREKFYALCDLISKNYTYDYDLYEKRTAARKRGEDAAYPESDIVTAYNTDRKVVCGGFSNVFYLTGCKLGLNCKIVYGKDHVFNLIKFSDKDYYMPVNLTNTRYGLVTSSTVKNNRERFDYQAAGEFGKLEMAAASTPDYIPATEIDNYRQFFYYLFHGYGLEHSLQENYMIQHIALIGIIILTGIILISVIFISPLIRRKRRRRTCQQSAIRMAKVKS